MRALVVAERFCLTGHVLSLVFGLAGLLLVLPNPEFIGLLPPFGQRLFGWSMMGGGVVYILLGAITVAIYAYRTLGWRNWLGFMLPAVFLSLSSELLGTSTGFPFGHYSYLNGLGYKIAGLVPFTIPLSWFYLGMSVYVLARAGLEAKGIKGWSKALGSIAIGSLLLTAWDFVLDPAMSQTPYPFWEFQDPGQFFGMPYRNVTGWLVTGAVFMSVATLFWQSTPMNLKRSQLWVPLGIYLVNFAFGAAITIAQLDARFWIPTLISILLGVVPAIALWWIADSSAKPVQTGLVIESSPLPETSAEGTVQTAETAIVPVTVLPK